MKAKFTGTKLSTGKNFLKICLGDDYLLDVSVHGEMNETDALEIFEKSKEIIAMAEKEGKYIRVLVNLNNAKPPSSKARKILARVDAQERVKRVAFWGLSPVSRVIANFLIAIGKREKMRFFSTEEEALSWVEEI